MVDKYVFGNPKTKDIEKELKLSTLLPEYIQTITNKNLFNATFENLFSRNKVESVAGYIGEKVGGTFNANTDFYLTERTKERQNYQLTPTVVAASADGEITHKYFYPDFIDHIRYQGGNVDSPERLLRQEYYSFSPMIDINKFVNYNQYYWLEKGPKTIDFTRPVSEVDYASNTLTVDNHGMVTGQSFKVGMGRLPDGLNTNTSYFAIVTGPNTFGLASTEQNATSGVRVNMESVTDVGFSILYQTDLIAIEGSSQKIMFGIRLSNGMVIRTENDVMPEWNGNRYIVEGVGSSIRFILLDELLGYDSSPYDTQPYDFDETSYIGSPNNIDYVTISRNSMDGNPWSMRNRWFHISVLDQQEINPLFQARRPIIEFDANIKLYNFGTNYRGRVHHVYNSGNVQEITGKPRLEIDGATVLDGEKILVIDDMDDTRTNKIYQVFGLEFGSLSLTDLGVMEDGDTLYIDHGATYGRKNVYMENGKWLVGQHRTNSTQDPLFDLFDHSGIHLSAETVYPGSTFAGSKLFGYAIDGTYSRDEFLQRTVKLNEYANIVFNNFISTETYTFISDFTPTTIDGMYFFKFGDEFRNHWHRSDRTVNQGIVDEFVIEPTFLNDGTPEYKYMYKLSQAPAEVDATGISNIMVNLNGEMLIEGVDFLVTMADGTVGLTNGDWLRLSETINLTSGDLLKCVTFNSKVPQLPIAGYYEVPSLVGLVSNSANDDITEIGRNDILEQFVSILERQNGFTGNALGMNNTPNMVLNYGRGAHIVQNTASMTKAMIVNSDTRTDVMDAFRYVDNEYKRFYNQFRQKVQQLNLVGYNANVPYVKWVDDALAEINLGKSSEFPFQHSEMAGREFIPPSASYLGLAPLYQPRFIYDTTLVQPRLMMRCHDGQLRPTNSDVPTITETQKIVLDGNTRSYVLDYSTVFPWEILVTYNGRVLSPVADYTVFGGNTIVTNATLIGELDLYYINDIIDRVLMFMEYEIYSYTPEHFKGGYREYDYLEVKPGFFRRTDYSVQEVNAIMAPMFNRWVASKGMNDIVNDTFIENNHKTWNYTGSALSDGSTTLKGSWRAVFDYFYDTDRPDTAPWEMLGYYAKPSWWTEEYGQAPYSSENVAMWTDIEEGRIVRGRREGTYEYLKRPGLSKYLPVDFRGDLRPFEEIFGIQVPHIQTSSREWSFGDIGPVEFEWRRSSHFNYAIAMTKYLLKPTRMMDQLWEPESDGRLFKDQFYSQYVSTITNRRPQNTTLEIHGTVGPNGEIIVKQGVQQVLVDYLKFQGLDAYTLEYLVHGATVRLGYRVGGFIEKNTARFVADNFGLVPSENVHVSLHSSASRREFEYSGHIFTRTENGYRINGYDVISRKFKYYEPNINSTTSYLNVGGTRPTITDWQPNVYYGVGTYVKVANKNYRAVTDHKSSVNFENDREFWAVLAELPMIGGITVRNYEDVLHEKEAEYNEVIVSYQEIYNILMGYQKSLIDAGWVFDFDENGVPIDYDWVARQLYNWILKEPAIGESITLSPFAKKATIRIDHGYIEKLNTAINGNWPVLSINGVALNNSNFSVVRDGNEFSLVIRDETVESIFGIRLSLREIEHVVIFDNVTNFHDIIYNDLYGIRQTRFKAYMNRSSDWNGTLHAGGNIIENSTIVSNIEKNTDDFQYFYDSDRQVIGGEFNKAAKKLVGFQDRAYFNNLMFDTRDAFQFYQGFLHDKGTEHGLSKFLRNDYVKSISNIDIHEEWAIRMGTYGAVSSYSSFDINLRQEDIRANPQIVTFLADGEDDIRNSIIEIAPDDDRYVYKRAVRNGIDQFATAFVAPEMPYAGYLSLYEAQYMVPFMHSISQTFFDQKTEIELRQRIWVASTDSSDWALFRIVPTDSAAVAYNNLNGRHILEIENNTLEEGQPIIVMVENLNTVLRVVSVSGSTVEVAAYGNFEVKSPDIDGSVAIYTLENIRFPTFAEFIGFTPSLSWDDTDLVAVDNFSHDRWALLDPTTGDIIRKQEKQIDLKKFVSGILYDSKTNINIFDLVPYHPLLNVLPFGVRQAVDYSIGIDPAKYDVSGNDYWTREMTGSIWWDLSTVKFIDYDQIDDIYKVNHWGNIFPGTSIDVYQWVRSPFPPSRWSDYIRSLEGMSNYSEESAPYDISKFVVNAEFNPLEGKYINYYYFWVKNNRFNPLNNEVKKLTSTYDVALQILDPTAVGLNWVTPISETSFIVSNLSPFLNDYTNVKLMFLEDKNNNVVHTEWYLMSEKTDDRAPPTMILDKMKDSIVGYVQITGTTNQLYASGITNAMITEYGTVMLNGQIDVKLPVPDPKINSMSPYGNLFRPRQSWFRDIVSARMAFSHALNRQLALSSWVDTTNDWKHYFDAAESEPATNEYNIKVASLFERDALIGTPGFMTGIRVLVEHDITEDGRWSLWAYNGGKFVLVRIQGFRVSDYWQYTDFYAPGFSASTFIDFTYNTTVERNQDLSNRQVGDIVKVLDDGFGNFIISEVVANDNGVAFALVGKQNGTIKIDPKICTCQYGNISLGYIFDGYFKTLSTTVDKNKVVIDMVREATRQNRVVDWAFKTSLVDIVGIEEGLEQAPVVKPDLSNNVIAYFNELKPYHVKVRGAVDRKFGYRDNLNLNLEDSHIIEETILIDRVSIVPDFTLGYWTAAERISASGGNPEDIIPGAKFRGTEIDGRYFNFFENVVGAGFDVNPYDSTILGYDFGFDDIQSLYDVVVNGREFNSPSLGASDIVYDGGSFYQPLLSANRPPELAKIAFGDTLSLDVFTIPRNVDIEFGYDTQSYDAEITEFNTPAGYDYTSGLGINFVYGPRIVEDLFLGTNTRTIFAISQIPQSNSAIFVYVNGMLLSENTDYTVNWGQYYPTIVMNTAPVDKASVKIKSYSVGGADNEVETIYEQNISSNEFKTSAILYPHYKIIALRNGQEAAFNIIGDHTITIPSAIPGDNVYIIVYEGSKISELNSLSTTWEGEPLDISLSSPRGPWETQYVVYKNGKHLVPSYIQYRDPVQNISTMTFNEPIRSKDHIKIFIDRNELVPTDWYIDSITNQVLFNTPRGANSEIISINDVISEYHVDGNKIFIHNIVDAVNQVNTVPSGTRVNLDGTIFTATAPVNGNIPVDTGISRWEWVSITFANPNDPVSATEISLKINNSAVIVHENESFTSVANRINGLSGITGVSAKIINNSIVMWNNGATVNLFGDWPAIGITNGVYRNFVDMMSSQIGTNYRVLTLDGKLRLIKRSGEDINFYTVASPYDFINGFGVPSNTTILGSKIRVVSMDDNTISDMRTEVFQGNLAGEYPVTTQGVTEFSSIVSVAGNDDITQSDFYFANLQFGYGIYGYDQEAYDYQMSLGIEFNQPQNEAETVMIITYNGAERKAKTGFKIFKSLNNEYSYYTLDDKFNTVVTQNFGQTDTDLFVRNADVLPVPSPDKNVPGYIWIGGEIIGYFEVDKSIPNNHRLSKLIRGARGTVFGYVNGGNGTNEYITAGTTVVNLSSQKMPYTGIVDFLSR